MKRHQAFTLIELLVVIAIIAILAAILFPVFAQAREKARSINCLSNEKQLSLAILQYQQDYDELMVPARNCETSHPCSWWTYDAIDWPLATEPYLKNAYHGASVFHCPSLENDYYGVWGSSSNPGGYGLNQLQEFINYGMNINYLQPDPQCSASATIDGQAGSAPMGKPASLAAIEAPAQTVLLAETKPSVIITSDCPGCFNPTDIVDAPATGGPTTNACSMDQDGWGFDDPDYDAPSALFGLPNTSTDLFDPRHNGGGNVAFCDGHTKWMTPGALAAGTNWHKGISYKDVKITDLSQYLWSLKKSGSSDL